MDVQRKTELIDRALELLIRERRSGGGWMPAQLPQANASFQEKWLTFRSLVNTREPFDADPEFLAVQDELLSGLIAEAGIATFADAQVSPQDDRLYLWKGDITTFAADAIVNAANSRMTGCWQPLHYCIDNAIHTFAGVQLRLECARLMEVQGYPEPTAHAKLTCAYNLPARRIIHTVGPIVQGQLDDCARHKLARCYECCLDAAAAEDLSAVVFCCISTGTFGFPNEEAAHIAVQTVRAWLDAQACRAEGAAAGVQQVVFDVFLDKDEALYRQELGL